MTDRKCSLCGHYYTDRGGHDYDRCVKELTGRKLELEAQLRETLVNLHRAEEIQKQDWWRKHGQEKR